MRIHILLPPHSAGQWKEDLTCAFTQRALTLTKLLADAGQDVFLYGPAGMTPVGAKPVEVLSEKEYRVTYAREEDAFYDCSSDNPGCALWNYRVKELLPHCMNFDDEDIICCSFGSNQEPAVRDLIPRAWVIESGIGYDSGLFAPFKIFESETWRHYHAGKDGSKMSHPTWRTIYNTFDPADFDCTLNRSDYALYLGRLIPEKGLAIAVKATKEAGVPLLIAGPGDPSPWLDSHVTYMGVADVETRKELLGKAKVLLMPTQYIEPLGYVHIEAMLSGTPVVTSNWGAFVETVSSNVGSRCDTLEDYVAGIVREYSPPDVIRSHAMSIFNQSDFLARHLEFFNDIIQRKLYP